MSFQIHMKQQHVRHYSITSKILTALYPDRQMTLQQLCDNLQTNKASVKHALMLMIKPNPRYIKTSDRKEKYNRSYSLTPYGRWFAMCTRLNVSFLSLCMLSDIYVLQKTMNESGTDGFYPVVRIRELIENTTNKNTTYSGRYLRIKFQQLIKQKIVKRLQKNIVSIYPNFFAHLKNNYEHDLMLLQRWFYSTIG